MYKYKIKLKVKRYNLRSDDNNDERNKQIPTLNKDDIHKIYINISIFPNFGVNGMNGIEVIDGLNFITIYWYL